MTRAVKIKTSSNLFLMFSSLCIVQIVFITQISLPAVTACLVTQSFIQLCGVLFLTLMHNKKDLIMLQWLAWPEERMLWQCWTTHTHATSSLMIWWRWLCLLFFCCFHLSFCQFFMGVIDFFSSGEMLDDNFHWDLCISTSVVTLTCFECNRKVWKCK